MTTHQIWKKYAEDVRRFILSKVKNNTIADDILQDTFIKIHTKIHTLKDFTKLKPWCFTIARNTILNHFKEHHKNFEIAQIETTENVTVDNEHTEKDCLHGILKNLPKKYRDPLFLSDIKGLKQHEVAAQLQQNLATTKSQIQRARKLIAQGFIDCCGFVINTKGNLVGEIQDKEDCKVCN